MQSGTFAASSLVVGCVSMPTPEIKSTLNANSLPRSFPCHPTDRHGAAGPSHPSCSLSLGDVLQCGGAMSTSNIHKEGRKKPQCFPSVLMCLKTKLNPSTLIHDYHLMI